jgi:hypothetical protein
MMGGSYIGHSVVDRDAALPGLADDEVLGVVSAIIRAGARSQNLTVAHEASSSHALGIMRGLPEREKEVEYFGLRHRYFTVEVEIAGPAVPPLVPVYRYHLPVALE